MVPARLILCKMVACGHAAWSSMEPRCLLRGPAACSAAPRGEACVHSAGPPPNSSFLTCSSYVQLASCRAPPHNAAVAVAASEQMASSVESDDSWIPPRLHKRPQYTQQCGPYADARSSSSAGVSPSSAAVAAALAAAAAHGPPIAPTTAEARSQLRMAARESAAELATNYVKQLKRRGRFNLTVHSAEAARVLHAAAIANKLLKKSGKAAAFEAWFQEDIEEEREQAQAAERKVLESSSGNGVSGGCIVTSSDSTSSSGSNSNSRASASGGTGITGGSINRHGQGATIALHFWLQDAPSTVDVLVSKQGDLPTAAWRQQEAADAVLSEQSLQLAAQLLGTLESAVPWPDSGGGASGLVGAGSSSSSSSKHDESGVGDIVVCMALRHAQLAPVLPALALLQPNLSQWQPHPLSAVCVAREAPALRDRKARRGVDVILELSFVTARGNP